MKFIKYFVVIVGLILVGSFKSYAYDAALTQAMDLTYNIQFDQAESTLNGYIAAHPGDPMGYMIRGTSRDWKQLVQNLRGSIDEKILADYQEANKLAFLLWDKDKDNVDKMIMLGNSYMFLAKKWLDMDKKSRAGLILKKCQKHLEEAVQKDPVRYDAYMANGIFNFYAANIPPGLGFIASILGISGNEKLGLEMVSKTAENPNLFQNHALFVLTYMYGQTKKNYAMAQTYLDRLATQFPQNHHFLFLKGEYAYRAKEYAKSREAFDQLFAFCGAQGKCVPNYTFLAHYFLASGYLYEKNYTAAKPHVDKAYELNTGQYKDRVSFIHLFKGQVLKSEGKNAEAQAEFQKAIAAPDGNPKAKDQAKQEMQGL